MVITPELIEAHKEAITNPKLYGLDIDSLTDCFKKSETVTAKHQLAMAYIEHINRPLPKLVLYIIMDEVYGQCDGKDENKNLGYHLQFVAPSQ